MGLVEILIFGIAIWLCIYALVERICRCIEHCALAKAFGVYANKSSQMSGFKLEDFLKHMNGDKKMEGK